MWLLALDWADRQIPFAVAPYVPAGEAQPDTDLSLFADDGVGLNGRFPTATSRPVRR